MASDDPDQSRLPSPPALGREVGKKEQRKLRARREGGRSVWFGLGMMGMVGWSVALPTVIGSAAGLWIDRTWPSRYSWTLTGLFVGVVVGCWMAWFWIRREGLLDHEELPTTGEPGQLRQPKEPRP